jgi:5-methylcytosine-specific restriction endonuclease McrBC GTP-binding regulatory subunit McrB
MSYEIDEGRLGCLIEIYAEFLERNSDYIKQKNKRLEFFKENLNKISNDKLTEEDIEKIFTKKEEEKKLDSAFGIKYKEKEAKLKLVNFLKALINFGEELKTKNKLNEVIDEFVEKMKPLIEGGRIGHALVTELLCVFYPDQYCIKNNKVKEMVEKLNQLEVLLVKEKNFYEDYDKLMEFERVILKNMENNEKLKNVYQQIIGRTNMNYYDVDAFLYWIIDKEKKEPEILKEQIEKCLERISEDGRSIKTLANYFQYKGFYFDEDLITAFYAALKTKGFVILSGLTGTGKTKLAQLFAELLCPNCFKKQSKEENTQNPQDEQNTQIAQNSSENQNQCKCTHLFLPVRPDWRDSKALLGYYNPITGKYERTPLLDFILKARDDYNKTNKNDASPYFIILDEMNLSHVEYYFADFLSVLESGRDQHGWTKETIKLHNFEAPLLDNNGEEKIPIPKEINLPPNLYIIGSVNIDETTYMFSPKVLDRAFTIEFWDVDFDNYISFNINNEKAKIKIDEDKAKEIAVSIHSKLLEDLRNKKIKSKNNKQNNDQVRFCGVVGDKEEIKEALKWIYNYSKKVNSEEVEKGKIILIELKQLNQILQSYDLHFGYRVLDEIALFIKYATNAPKEVGELQPEQALDFAVLMKVLPKFHGPRQKLERPLWLVLNWCLRNLKIQNDDDLVKVISKDIKELKKEIWKNLTSMEIEPKIEDLIGEIQKLIQELKSDQAKEKVSQQVNTQSQTSGENQNQTQEETQERESDHPHTEQKPETEKTSTINNVKYKRTALKVLKMLKQLYETGFASFA